MIIRNVHELNEAIIDVKKRSRKDKTAGFDVFDETKTPKLKVKLSDDLCMFYGMFGWAIGNKSGIGTASQVKIDMVKLEEKL